MASVVAVVAAASNLLIRLAVYFYTRVIPAGIFKFIIPPLYFISVAATVAAAKQNELALKEVAPPVDAVVVVEKEEVKVEEKADGEVKTEETVVATVPVPAVAPPQPTTFVQDGQKLFALLAGTNVSSVYTVVVLNTLLFLAAIHMTLEPFFFSYEDVVFTRVGAVQSTTAKIQARYPSLANSTATILYRSPARTGAAWKDGPMLSFDEVNDFIAVATLKGLYPNTAYEYVLADANSTVLPYPSTPIAFRTFPDSRLGSGNHFKFLVSSCMSPNFPYSPVGGNRIKGMDYLAHYLWPTKSSALSPQTPAEASTSSSTSQEQSEIHETTATSEAAPVVPTSESESATTAIEFETASSTTSTTSAPIVEESPEPTLSHDAPTEFMLFLGDFIYADVPAGLTTKEWYQKLYRRVFASESFRKVYERLPIFTIYDDHEFGDNFAGNGADQFTEPWTNASSAYASYLGDANFDNYKGENYYDFRYGDSAFFVMDTRRYRSDDTVEEASRTMLGDKQLSALYNWLGRVNGTATWKFVVSSVPLSSLWKFDAERDSWAAFARERSALLDVLRYVPNVVVLSGDRHQYALVDYFEGGFLEISTSPLSMFGVSQPWSWGNIEQHSAETFNRTLREGPVVGEGSVEPVESAVPKERLLGHVPDGSYKVTSIEVDNRDTFPRLYIELVSEGRPRHRYTVKGVPVTLSTTQALGQQISQGFKDFLGMMRIKPLGWF